MRKLLCVLAAMVLVVSLFSACSDPTSGSGTPNGSEQKPNSGLDDNTPKPEDKEDSMQIYLTINGSRLSVTLEDNRATAELKEKLKASPITINMSDYGGFEKVGGLGFSLPTDNRQITTKPLDIMLYQGNQMVIFYDSNSWSYTPIGRITGVTTEELKTILGSGNTTVTLSLN